VTQDELRAEVGRLLHRADDLHKAATNRPDPELGRRAARAAVASAEELAGRVTDPAARDDLLVAVGRRLDDLDRADHAVSRVGADRGATLPQPGPHTLDPPSRTGDDRLAPGQRRVHGLPVLHVGSPPPPRAVEDVELVVTGLVAGRRHVVGWDLLSSLPAVTTTVDIHCVTAWSRLDVAWTGVTVRSLLDHLGGVDPTATHALAYGHPAYSANLDLATLLRDDVLLAWAVDGQPLTLEHGGPLRLVVPTRYFWKSTKWLDRIQLLDHDVPGFWEARGYHNVGDPFLEQRYG
jgi:DMSO/TMAO reductase YedYZ molybdopterin-dependent catalytic subunit